MSWSTVFFASSNVLPVSTTSAPYAFVFEIFVKGVCSGIMIVPLMFSCCERKANA